MKGLKHLCTWFSCYLFKFLRRRLILILPIAFLVVVLLRWKLMCTNMQHLHLPYVCSKYASGESLGTLCQDLCQPEGISSLSCHNFYDEKHTVLTGIWKNTSIVLKSVKTSSETVTLHGLDDLNKKKYPSEEHISNMIKSIVKLKFNISMNAVDAKRMLYDLFDQKLPSTHAMESTWLLLQSNEYLALSLYNNFNLFPKLLGNCGSLYAVEKMNPISGFWHLMTLYDSQEQWQKRIKISLMILDFLVVLDKVLPEPLVICNVKMNSFGVTDDHKKISYLNLDSVHPVSIASSITGDGSHCRRHSDCDFSDCRSYCNLISFKCQHGVINNNLQMICERIFLGWTMSGKVMVPGLLLGPRTPRVLVEVLEQCANPAGEVGTPRAKAANDIRKRLYDLLVHLTWS